MQGYTNGVSIFQRDFAVKQDYPEIIKPEIIRSQAGLSRNHQARNHQGFVEETTVRLVATATRPRCLETKTLKTKLHSFKSSLIQSRKG